MTEQPVCKHDVTVNFCELCDEELQPGVWYWVSDDNGETWWIAKHEPGRCGGWTNDDTWEDFGGDVKQWRRIGTRPDVTIHQPQWQPIDTAPRDGRDVIVGWDMATVWIVRSAWWRSAEDVSHMPDADHTDIGWWSYIHSVTQEKLDGIHEPTHWLCEVGETPDKDKDA